MSSVVVVFEETGEEREVRWLCVICNPGREFAILSPTGCAHESGETSETTRCGRDATGDDWWHRL